MSDPSQHRATLARIAKQCQAKYSSDDKKLFDKPPASTTAPTYHMARAYLTDDSASFLIVQNQITFLDCKARNGRSFNADEKEFLVNLYEAMQWGGRLRGYREAGDLARAYVHGNGARVSIPPAVYRESAVVKTAQTIFREVFTEHFSKSDSALAIKSTDKVVRDKIVKLRRTKTFDVNTEGDIYANGILKAPENNPRLKYADNRFALQASAKVSSKSPDSKTISVTWKVESKYDFASYEENPDHLSTLPIIYPGTKVSSPKEAQKLLAEIFPEYMKISGRYSNSMVLPDGLSKYMVREGIATEFTYGATWLENLPVKIQENPTGSSPNP